ncbi:hypothetical protein BKA80DRAFT_12681 [Phyllosticta citrichinensis]
MDHFGTIHSRRGPADRWFFACMIKPTNKLGAKQWTVAMEWHAELLGHVVTRGRLPPRPPLSPSPPFSFPMSIYVSNDAFCIHKERPPSADPVAAPIAENFQYAHLVCSLPCPRPLLCLRWRAGCRAQRNGITVCPRLHREQQMQIDTCRQHGRKCRDYVRR